MGIGGFAAVVALVSFVSSMAGGAGPLRFAILGDRAGEAQAGVYERVWQEAADERPAFVITTGDTIEGANDGGAERQWREAERILGRYRSVPLYLVPGNHDIWSETSERLFRKHAGRPPHYGFDYGPAHFTVLDNSRSDELPAAELAFLEQDLKAHAGQPVKFVFLHRPSWLMPVALQDARYALHRIARQYGVAYVISGHVHQMLRLGFEGVTYVSMPSSGGHLRNSGEYADGWFFGHALVELRGTDVSFRIEELKPPYGRGRVTRLEEWGMAGQRAAGGSASAGMPAR
jgi:3',5'-cyclic-AMP phosphodiesterase